VSERVVFGVRPVEELCRARPREVSVIYVADGYRSTEIDRLVATARDRAINIEFRPRQMVAELAGDAVHQGVVALTGEYAYAELGAILALAAPVAAEAGAEPLLLLLLDGITDPHNFGALVRSAEVLGAHGVVVPDALFHIPQRGAIASLNASVAGAIALYEAARQRQKR
jgi:23S rRNA (guanosine2251-2'-O)-methyltransferase